MPSKTRDLWWVISKRNPRASMRMLCFPYAGGSASIFHTWHRALPEQIEIYGVQLPGRANRYAEPPLTRVSSVVQTLGPALIPLLDRPYVLFGHSLGATLCFEVARWLRLSRQPLPQKLLVSGRRAPQLPDTDPPHHTKSDQDFLEYIRELQGTPDDILTNQELINLLLPSLRADCEMAETYEYLGDAPLSCPITAFGGTDDLETSEKNLDDWCLQTTNKFTQFNLKGGHFFLHSNQHALLGLLRGELMRLIHQGHGVSTAAPKSP